MKKSDLKKANLPDSPGVYKFLDEKGAILYIGKATSLRDRVRSYFGDDLVQQRGKRLVDMVAKSSKIDHAETDSVLEALILEANLIKKYQPQYNVKEKDNTSFYFVVITKEDFPKVLLMRGRELEKKLLKNDKASPLKVARKFGPFPYGTQIKEALRIVRKIFPFQDKYSVKKDQAEFYRQIGLAPDLSDAQIKTKYKFNIDNVSMFFQGKKRMLLKKLKEKMMRLAGKMKFEEANEIKKQIFALEHIKDVSLIKKENIDTRLESFRIEAYDISHISGTNMVGVMTVIENGEVAKSEYRKFKVRGFDSSNDVGALEEIFRRRMGHPEWATPNLIVVDGAMPQKSRVQKILNELGVKIPVVAVVKNEKHKPKGILGSKKFTEKYKDEIILANSESHRFAVKYHRGLRSKNL